LVIRHKKQDRKEMAGKPFFSVLLKAEGLLGQKHDLQAFDPCLGIELNRQGDRVSVALEIGLIPRPRSVVSPPRFNAPWFYLGSKGEPEKKSVFLLQISDWSGFGQRMNLFSLDRVKPEPDVF